MTGAWQGGLQWGRAVAYSVITATAGGSPFTMGSWFQITSSTPTDCTWAQIMIRATATPAQAIAVDVGIGGAGSEVEVVGNLVAAAVSLTTVDYVLPLQIAAGVRISVRTSSATASQATAIQLVTFDDAYVSSSGPSSIDTYGFFTTSNLGILVDPTGAPNTKGSYAEITSATTNDIAGIFLGFDNQSDVSSGTVGNLYWLVDIAVGAAGSEKPILPNYSLTGYSTSTNALVNNMTSPYFPMPIPAGSRLSARAQCSTATFPDRRLGVTIYGVRA